MGAFRAKKKRKEITPPQLGKACFLVLFMLKMSPLPPARANQLRVNLRRFNNVARDWRYLNQRCINTGYIQFCLLLFFVSIYFAAKRDGDGDLHLNEHVRETCRRRNIGEERRGRCSSRLGYETELSQEAKRAGAETEEPGH